MKKVSNTFGKEHTVQHLGFRCVGPTMTVKKLQRLYNDARARAVHKLRSNLKVLAGKSRFLILYLLAREPELCVCDLADILHMETSAVSQQLRVLRLSKLVQPRKIGNVVLYRLSRSPIRNMLRALTTTI